MGIEIACRTFLSLQEIGATRQSLH
jgi:hypothetical protein